MVQQSIKYRRFQSSFENTFNSGLAKSYSKRKSAQDTEKTHYFGGRYENVYIDRHAISELPIVLDQALLLASEFLGTDKSKLQIGFWFNEMHQGHSTTAHTHDEDDELLSGVYYIQVPENSGDLILGDEKQHDSIRITPKAGEFVFFAPDCLHSVTANQSDQMRLSIGFNVGPKA